MAVKRDNISLRTQICDILGLNGQQSIRNLPATISGIPSTVANREHFRLAGFTRMRPGTDSAHQGTAPLYPRTLRLGLSIQYLFMENRIYL